MSFSQQDSGPMSSPADGGIWTGLALRVLTSTNGQQDLSPVLAFNLLSTYTSVLDCGEAPALHFLQDGGWSWGIRVQVLLMFNSHLSGQYRDHTQLAELMIK